MALLHFPGRDQTTGAGAAEGAYLTTRVWPCRVVLTSPLPSFHLYRSTLWLLWKETRGKSFHQTTFHLKKQQASKCSPNIMSS